MFFAFRTHLIHQPFASNAMSCMTQQLLLRYQIPQYDRHHFPVTGILLIGKCHIPQLCSLEWNRNGHCIVQLTITNFVMPIHNSFPSTASTVTRCYEYHCYIGSFWGTKLHICKAKRDWCSI